MRNAPSIPLITALMDIGALVRAYAPVGMEQTRQVFVGIELCDGPYAYAKDADALVIVTEWEQFRGLRLRAPPGRHEAVSAVGFAQRLQPRALYRFTYYGIGRGERPTQISNSNPQVVVGWMS
jgi:UDPglucose 6-dehydrogenase